MINNEDYRHFICVVAGNEPEKLMEEFQGKKFEYYTKPVLLGKPVILKSGHESKLFSYMKSEVDWEKTHFRNKELFSRIWNLANGAEAKTDEEKKLSEIVQDKSYYLDKFGDMGTFVSSNCAFWGYAFLSDITGWLDMTSVDGDLYVWSSNFYDLFIKNLKDDTLITIYECTKKISED